MRLKTISRAWTLALGGLLLAGSVDRAQAQCQANELAKLLASDGAAGDAFGTYVSISGDVAVIAAHYDDDNGSSSGSAYVFRYDGSNWLEEDKLLASDGAASDQFGYSVAISGDVAVIGAGGDDDNGEYSGSAYVFRCNGSGWVEEAKLHPADGTEGDYFGRAVALSGDAVVIGADGREAAYVFRYDGSSWVEEAKLLPSDPPAAHFGEFVSISGDCVVVGAWYDDNNGVASGSAYVYRYDGWTWVEEDKLLASDGAAGDDFGNGVAVSDDIVLIGARDNVGNGEGSGAAYVFRYDGSTWVEEAKLLASDGAADDSFGICVGVSGDIALIGAYGDDDNGSRSGSAYVFRYDGSQWLEQAKLLPADGATDDQFAKWSLAISGHTALIGALGNDDNGSNSGSAYIFRGLSDCQPNGVLDICDIADGISDDNNGNGVPDECEEACQANELAKLLASDGAAGDWFGNAVGVSDDIAVIGAYADDDNGDFSGSAYVFRYDGSAWVQEAKLLPSDGAADDQFGISVGISGETAVIGARYDDTNGSNSGSVYVFRYDGCNWSEEFKHLPSDGEAGDSFGRSVAIASDAIVVGAPGDDDNGSNSGSAYVSFYDGSNWIVQKLLASDGTAGDYFGTSVAISDDTIVIGAEQDGDNGEYSGSAYVFRYDGWAWAQEAKLLASDGAAYDCFGVSVAISGDTALIGANNDEPSGSAYVFHYDGSTWLEQAKLLASDGAAGDGFGFSVTISDQTVLIGAGYGDGNASNSGSAYVFRYDPGAPGSWVERAKLLASDGATFDEFGRRVAVSGDTAVIGAPRDDDNGSSSGSAYIFRGLSDCQPNGVLDICDIADGTSDDDNGNGIPDECECPGDVDGDGDTDHSDLGVFLSDWGCQPPNDCVGDLDGDGYTGHSDLGILLADWGCGT